MQAACAARRWLARHAARIARICGGVTCCALECAGLVSCLPALEHLEVTLHGSRDPDDLGCLLDMLAWCPRLSSLGLLLLDCGDEGDEPQPFPDAPASAKLRSLTKLVLEFDKDMCTLADVVDALSSVTGLTELAVSLPQPAVVPTALGQLRSLQALHFQSLFPCVLEAGCLDLPRLAHLEFTGCKVDDAEVLAGVTALQSLTSIIFARGQGPPFVAQLLQLPCLQRMVSETAQPCPGIPSLGLAALVPLSSALLQVIIHGHGLTHFPLALTQLVGLECLHVNGNEFAELPTGITALSRLTELSVGRLVSQRDPLQLHGKRPLDVRALGDLSAFPALRELGISLCEVLLCESLLGAVRHPCLAKFHFRLAHPAPECAMVVLQLGRALRRLGRGSMLQFHTEGVVQGQGYERAVREAQGRAPLQKFMAGMEACGL